MPIEAQEESNRVVLRGVLILVVRAKNPPTSRSCLASIAQTVAHHPNTPTMFLLGKNYLRPSNNRCQQTRITILLRSIQPKVEGAGNPQLKKLSEWVASDLVRKMRRLCLLETPSTMPAVQTSIDKT